MKEAGAPQGERGRRNGRKSAYSARDGVAQALNIFTETAGGIAARQQCAAETVTPGVLRCASCVVLVVPVQKERRSTEAAPVIMT